MCIVCSRSPCRSFSFNNFRCEYRMTIFYIAVKPFKCWKRLYLNGFSIGNVWEKFKRLDLLSPWAYRSASFLAL